MDFFNPKVQTFIEEHKGMTVLGFFWAMYWRFCVAVAVIAFLFSLVNSILSNIK